MLQVAHLLSPESRCKVGHGTPVTVAVADTVAVVAAAAFFISRPLYTKPNIALRSSMFRVLQGRVKKTIESQ